MSHCELLWMRIKVGLGGWGGGGVVWLDSARGQQQVLGVFGQC